MDLLTIALIVIALWFGIALLLAFALAHASGNVDDVTERLLTGRDDELDPSLECVHGRRGKWRAADRRVERLHMTVLLRRP
jgi:hypothetical protein